MHDEDYLIVDPACVENERGTRDENDGNEVIDDGDLPLDLELTKRVDVDDETLPYAKEDWDCSEQTEVKTGVEPDFPFSMESRQGKRGRDIKKYNQYGEDFVVDRTYLSDVADTILGLDEIVVSQEIDLTNNTDQDSIGDCSEPEREFENEVEQMHEK